MKYTAALVFSIMLVGCGPKKVLVPVPYMPEPPQILMQAPQDLNTIKKQAPKGKNDDNLEDSKGNDFRSSAQGSVRRTS